VLLKKFLWAQVAAGLPKPGRGGEMTKERLLMAQLQVAALKLCLSFLWHFLLMDLCHDIQANFQVTDSPMCLLTVPTFSDT
jgi:hypothetical protein